MAKILVTGGAGFIGSHVVDAFVAAGHDVVVVDNLYTGFRENLNPAARFYEVDIRSEELGAVFEKEKPEVVDHLAAQMDVRHSLEDPLFDADVNILGSIKLLEQCKAQGVRKVLFASTGGAIYGEPATLPADEDCEPRPLCHYGASKLAVEHYIRLYGDLFGLKFTILRYPNVYGPRQNPHGEAGVCAILAGLMLAGKTPVLYGHGKPLRDYVYVADIARANVLALERGDGDTLNLGSGKGVPVAALFDEFKEIIGFDGAAALQPLRAGEVRKIYITGDRAEKALGWRPSVELRQGLAATVSYIREKAV